MPHLTVIRPGMLTTVQDLGRWGYQSSGVPVAGPMDMYSHRAANRLVGNPDNAAALEITVVGPELEASGDMVCAVAGAAFDVTAGGGAVAPMQPFAVARGGRIRFGTCRAGARATLAVRGGLDLPPVLGSRATSLVSRMGPFGGRALAAGDILPIGSRPDGTALATPRPLPLPRGGARLRVIAGPHTGWFSTADAERLFGSRFTITPAANRMGYRLDGPAVARTSGVLPSDATPMGSLQVPGNGQPILLMADRQTTGGYPRLATVITADLPLAAQLVPGDWIEFAPCRRPDALAALSRQEARLHGRVDAPRTGPRR